MATQFDFNRVQIRLKQAEKGLSLSLANVAKNDFLNNFREQGFNGQKWREVQRRIAGTRAYEGNKDLGKRFTKYRLALGTSYNLKGPKSLDVKYVFGRNINLAKNEKEHIFSLTYNYDWEKLTPEEKAKRAKAKAKKKLKKHPELEAEE